MRCIYTEVLHNSWPSYRQWSRYHITVCKVNTATQAVRWLTQMIWVEKVPISDTTLNSITLNFIAALSGYISYYGTTTDFMTQSIYYNLKSAKWSEQYSVHKINPDITFMCELHVTVKLYIQSSMQLVWCWLTFLPDQRNSCSCSLLNVCTTVQQYIGKKVVLWKERCSNKFK